MKKNIIKMCLATLAVLFGFGFFSNGAMAEEVKVDHHLGITPTQSNLGEIEPGKSYKGSFSVINEGLAASDFEIDFAPYGVKNEFYEPVYDGESSYTEISKWIKTSVDGGRVEPGKEVKVDFTVDVPMDAHGGSQSAIITVRLKTDDGNVAQSSVETVQELGYIVFGNVDGEIVKTGKVLENKVPSFLFNPPVIGTSVVENTGNVYTTAQYSLQVFPLFSDEEVYTNEEKPDENIVFPETKRYNEIKWDGAPHLGIFRVRQTVKIFDEESVTEKLVFLCPMWFLFIILLLIFCIIFWLVSRVFKRKREA